MIGNDIVDLLDAESRPESYRPRFDARVFTASEREAIAADERPLARRWAHWAAKEASYKLARQLDPGFVFAPGRWSVDFAEARTGRAGRERSGTIALPALARSGRSAARSLVGGAERPLSLALRSIETDDYVHVLALPHRDRHPDVSDWNAIRFEAALLGTPSSGAAAGVEALDASRAVRALAISGIAAFLDVEPERLAVSRSTVSGEIPGDRRAVASRIPRVRLDGREIALGLSLSHHGRWIAYATTLPLNWAIEEGWAVSDGLGATA